MKVVVFDFDGVLIPSEEIKQNGYRWMFSEFGEDVPEEAIRLAREEFSNARGNRYDIIRSICARIGKTDIESDVTKYAERFGDVVRNKLAAFTVEPNVRAMLERAGKGGPLYINSNTPDEPLKETLRSLGIADLFKGVRGSSDGSSKADRLHDIARAEGVTASDLVFIGDGEGDRAAAEMAGCEFIGIATDLNGWKTGSEFTVLGSVSEFGISKRGGFERMV
jgi:phosphoglycolate phosphatase-like HAD superfamily hydrolase